eukprot:6265100-Prorocentrum_lima.AAC.1
MEVLLHLLAVGKQLVKLAPDLYADFSMASRAAAASLRRQRKREVLQEARSTTSHSLLPGLFKCK